MSSKQKFTVLYFHHGKPWNPSQFEKVSALGEVSYSTLHAQELVVRGEHSREKFEQILGTCKFGWEIVVGSDNPRLPLGVRNREDEEGGNGKQAQ